MNTCSLFPELGFHFGGSRFQQAPLIPQPSDADHDQQVSGHVQSGSNRRQGSVESFGGSYQTADGQPRLDQRDGMPNLGIDRRSQGKQMYFVVMF